LTQPAAVGHRAGATRAETDDRDARIVLPLVLAR
jgi:hypothetical protein